MEKGHVVLSLDEYNKLKENEANTGKFYIEENKKGMVYTYWKN